MKRKLFLFVVFLLMCSLDNFVEAQTLIKYAKQSNQELAEKQRMEKANYEKACEKGTLDAYNEYLSMYPKGKYVQDVKSRILEIERKKEQEMYDNASKVETIQAYESYLKKYPNGRYAQEAKGRIEDMELWKQAKSTNTIDAYKNYLNKSRNKSFTQLANDAITDLESKDAWEAIRHSSSRTAIENFILSYPKSSCLHDATKRHDELLAVELYEQGYLQRAYEKFQAAGGRYSIELSNRIKFDKCLEFVEYKKLNTSSTENDLLAFLKNYPSSQYYDEVSNMVAINKARKFTMYTNDYIFNEAMTYAKDKATRNTVQGYIDNAKSSYSQYKRHQRHNRIMANGGYVKFGLEIMDFGVAGFSSSDEEQASIYYNMGVSVKFGNYRSPVQFEIGLKPGIVYMNYKTIRYSDDYRYGYDYRYSYEEYKNKTFFHMPVYVKLKLNICDAGSSKFYIAGIGLYNAVKEENFENDYSVGGGIGFARKKWDWFALYYKQDVENKLHIEDKCIGTSIVYYF